MSRVYVSQFHCGLGWYKHIKVWHAMCDCNIRSSVFMKQHSRYCKNNWSRVDHQSSLNHLEINFQKSFIVFWMKEFQEIIHFTVINLFNQSGVWIWKWFRVRLTWKLWSVNFNINVINGMMIKSPHDRWNHRVDFGSRGPGFEVSLQRLAVPFEQTRRV